MKSRSRRSRSRSPIDDQQHELALQQEQLQSKIDALQQKIDELPKRAAEDMKRRQNELISEAAQRVTRLNSNAALADPRHGHLGGPRRIRKPLRTEMIAARRKAAVLLVIFIVAVVWLYAKFMA